MDKTCLTCRKSFYVSPSRSHIKNCSYICNKIWRKAEEAKRLSLVSKCKCGCGTDIKTYRGTRLVQYVFGHSPQMAKGQTNSGSYRKGHEGMQQDKNPNWRGGFVMRNGYKSRRINGRRIYLHRYIMEQKLGRRLESDEHVHHINHNKLDNRPENLEIIDPQEHARYHAKVMWGTLERVGG